jgi:hypothetical protein
LPFFVEVIIILSHKELKNIMENNLTDLKMLLISHNTVPFESPFNKLKYDGMDIIWYGNTVYLEIFEGNFDIIYNNSHDFKSSFNIDELLNLCMQNSLANNKRIVYAYSYFIPFEDRLKDNSDAYQIDIVTFENGEMLPNIIHEIVDVDMSNIECMELIEKAYFDTEKTKKNTL